MTEKLNVQLAQTFANQRNSEK